MPMHPYINSFKNKLQQKLKYRQEKNLFRVRHTLATRHGPIVKIQADKRINFCSNDYLGLSNHPQIVAAFKAAADKFGISSSASPLVSGRCELHQQLEAKLAEKTGHQAALTFSSGYLANLALVSTLAKASTGIFMDRLAHASLIDAARLSVAKLHRYQHADPESLDKALKKSDFEEKLVLTDTVFSMDGDEAPLAALSGICNKNQALLAIDDAHGFGVLGEAGGGSLEKHHLSVDQVPIQVATFGKALGTAGAFIAADASIIETLVQFGRSYIYTTAQPPALTAATLAALEILVSEPWRRTKLTQLIQRFRNGFAALDTKLNLLPSQTAIQPLLIGDSETAMQISQKLLASGFLITAIRPPTVPEGSARLRITLTAAHTEAQVDKLIEALSKY